jgi:glutathione S-transferase
MVKLVAEELQTKEVLGWDGLHLIHFSGSSCSQKLRIFLNLKGLNWTSHHLNLAQQDNYKPWFLGINPRGLVPVLVHDGDVHIESNDILVYLDEAFPELRLIPDDVREDITTGLEDENDLHLDLRALTMRFIVPKFLARKSPESLNQFEQAENIIDGELDSRREVELGFWRTYDALGITDQRAREATLNFFDVFELLDQRLSESRYLCGSELTLLDIAWFISTHRLAIAGYPFAKLHPRVDIWHRHLLTKPEFSAEVQVPASLKMVTSAMQLLQLITSSTLSHVAEF